MIRTIAIWVWRVFAFIVCFLAVWIWFSVEV